MQHRSANHLWFHLAITSGFMLAIVLLISSVSTYLTVSRGLVLERLRGDLHSQASTLEQQARRDGIQTRTQLLQLLQQSVAKSNGRIAWAVVRNRAGEAVATAGAPAASFFSAQDIQIRMRTHKPIFKIAGSNAKPLLIEVLPFMLPSPLRLVQEVAAGGKGHPASTIELAEFWGGTDAALWSVRRHLMVNLAAAVALLAALAILTLRFRSYLAGRKLEQEVEIASSVQRDLLPSAQCKLEGFEIAGDYMPVSPVGGDFYDAFAVEDGRAAFVLGDVSGKGIPAALLMGVLHGAVRASGWTHSSAGHRAATREINRLLCQRASATRFATMFWSYFDPASQHLKYINAGHCPPLLLKRGHRDAVLHLSAGGPVLGVLAHAEFQQGSVRLDPGDVLVLYSDGIVEAANSAEEEFGEDRVLAAVQAHAGESAEKIRNHILAAVSAFAGAAQPQDDRTLVVAVYLAAEQRSQGLTDRRADDFVAYAA